MDDGQIVSIPCRKELRRLKLMEYLAAKGKLKLTEPKLRLRDNCRDKKPATSSLKSVKGKENKAPDAVGTRNKDTKVQPLGAKAVSHPTGTGPGGSNKASVRKGAVLPGPSGPTQPKQNQNPVLTRTYTIASSRSSHSAINQPKKQPSAGTHAALISSGKSFPNAACVASASQSSSKSNSGANFTRPALNKTTGLCPDVKARTRLVPAVVQPRNAKSNPTSGLAAAAASTTTTSMANRLRSSTTWSVSVSQRSAMAQRKTLPTSAVNKPVQGRTKSTEPASAGIKVQARSMSNSQPLVDRPRQPSCKSQISTVPKPTRVSSRRTAAPVKPDEKERVPQTTKVVVQPTNKPAQQRSEVHKTGNGGPCKVGSRASSMPPSRSQAVNRFVHAAVAEPGAKAKAPKGMDNKKGDNSAKVPPPPKAGTKTAGFPLMPQTVPCSLRTVSQAGWDTDMKTPRAPLSVVPQTEGKKVTAAQEERARKLQEWREAKGISYKRPPMQLKPPVKRSLVFPRPYWASMEEDEAHSLISAVDRSLSDCVKLLSEGCPLDQVKEVLSLLPAVAQKFAKYWICRARLMERQGDLDVLPMFEEAVRVVLEPVDELRTVVFEILKKKDEIQGLLSVSADVVEEDRMPEPGNGAPEGADDPAVTPNKPIRAHIWGERGDSSVVKYKITTTPGSGLRRHQREPARVDGQEVRFFTPVRRSRRIERASLRHPASLQDHDLCVTSYDDLIAEEENREQEGRQTSPAVHDTRVYVYRENKALKDQVFVQVFQDDE